MVPLNENLPFLRTGVALFHDPFAALVQGHLPRRSTESIGAGIDRVLDHAGDQLRRGRNKFDGRLAQAFWQFDLLLTIPKVNLPCGPQLAELLKQ